MMLPPGRAKLVTSPAFSGSLVAVSGRFNPKSQRDTPKRKIASHCEAIFLRSYRKLGELFRAAGQHCDVGTLGVIQWSRCLPRV